MCLGMRDGDGVPYIKPVTETDKSTDITLSINFPQGNVVQTVATIDNCIVDVETWNIYIGTNVINALHSVDLETQFTTDEEKLTQTFLKSEFITGIVGEIRKLVYISSIVCKNEQHINAALRYINEVRNLGMA